MERSAALIGLRLLACLVALNLFGQGPSVPARGKALVVGNAAYKNLPAVPMAGADARTMAKTLTGLGLTVTLIQDAEISSLAGAVNAFVGTLVAGEPALFYYSGYAVQDKGENYLLPLSYQVDSADPVEFSAYSLKRLERFVEAKKPGPGTLLIEAAPLPPVLSRHFGEPGLALMDVRTSDMLLVFASLPGQGVKDPGTRSVSYFTQAWLEELEKPWISLDTMSRNVKQRVVAMTGGVQAPTEMSTLVKPFAFRARPPQEMEWEQLTSSRDLVALRAFVQRYPGDPLAKLAEARLLELDWAQTRGLGTTAALLQFLQRYPGHPEASRALATAEAAEKSSRTDGVIDALNRYSKAFSEKNLEGVKAVRPSLSAQEMRTLEASFRMAKTVAMTLVPKKEPQINGTNATVPCEMKVEMRMDRSAPPPVTQQVVVSLTRAAAGWMIDSIR